MPSAASRGAHAHPVAQVPAPEPVEIIFWPDSAARRDDLARRGVPRLLVLDGGTLPPERVDDLEDWIWSPFDERDLVARLARLSAAVDRMRPAGDEEIVVDDEGVLQFRGRWTWLPPAEAEIVRTLCAPPGRLCSRAVLERAAWGDAIRRPHSLDSRIFTLRTRLARVGLSVASVRGRGFVLQTRR